MKLLRLLLAAVFVVIGMAQAQNVMQVDNALGSINSAVTVNVSITNADPFTSFQTDILIPTGFTYVSGTAALNPARLPSTGSHILVPGFIAPNILRLLCYSPTNANFSGNQGPVVSFQFDPGSNVCGNYNVNIAPGSAYIYNAAVVNIMTGFTNGVLTLNPLVTCPGNSDVCVATPAYALTGGLPAGGVYSGAGVSGGMFDPAIAGVGTHTITYTYNCAPPSSASCTFQITVTPLMAVGTVASSQTICTGTAPVMLTSTPPTGGTSPTYQWQSSLNNSTFNNILGATGTTYAPGVLTTTTYYRQMQNATGSCGGPLPTNSVTITVDPDLAVGTVSADQIICAGVIPALLTSTPPTTGTLPTYQWQSSLNNTTFTNINGATAAVYQSAALTTTTYYRQLQNASNTCGGPLPTNVVTVTVNPLPAAVAGADRAICIGVSTQLGAAAVTGNTYSWTSVPAGFTSTEANPTVSPVVTTTYTLIETVTLTGCTKTNSVVVTVNPLPVVTAGTYGPACANAPVIALVGSPAGGVWTGTGVTGNQTSGYTFNPAAGTQTLTYTYTDGNGCVNSATTSITVYPLTPVSAGTYGPVCSNSPDITLVGSPAGGVWTGTGVSGNQTTGYVFDPSVGVQTLTYAFTDANACVNTATTTVVFYPVIAVGSISANQMICSGDTPALLVGVAPSNGTSPTYQWQSSLDNNTFSDISGATTLDYQPGAITVATYFRLLQNATGVCDGPLPTNVVTITFYPNLAVGSISANQSICSGNTPALLTGMAPSNGTSPTYQWQTSLDNTIFTDITGATNLNYQPGAITATTYFRLLQNATGTCGGPLPTNVVTITFYPNLTVGSISANQTICSGLIPAQLMGVAPANGTAPTYQWQSSPDNTTFTNITGATNQNYQPGALTSTTYFKALQNASGTCGGPLATNVVTVTVNAIPVPTVTGAATTCQNTTNNTYTTETGMTGYTWTVSAGGTITAGSGTNVITVTWNQAGAQTVCVNYINANMCTAVTPTCFNVTVNPSPTITINGLATVCAGTTGVAYNTQPGMSAYVWTIVGGTITSGQGSNNVLVTWTTAGAQSISVNYSNGTCTAPTPTVYPVTVNALPVPTVTGPATVCVNSTGNVYTTQTGMTGYVWTVSTGGTITAGAASNAITVTWNTAGAQTVTVNYANANNCMAATATVYNVTVNALPVPTLTGPTSACLGATTTYTTQSGMTNYVWPATISGGTIVSGGTPTSNTITINWTTLGIKAVTVNYTTPIGCTGAAPGSISVTVNPAPTPTIGSTNDPCLGTSVVYYTESGMTGYVWTVSAGGTIISGQGTATATVQWNVLGGQQVCVNYTNTNGCNAPTPTCYSVFVNSPPSAPGTITGPSTACAGTTGVFSIAAMPSGATGLIWSVPPGSTFTPANPTTGTSITVTFGSTSGSVTVYGTNSSSLCNGPSSSKSVTINQLPAAAGAITGPASVCSGSTYVYTVPAITGATSYVWTIPTGATGTSTTNTISITFVNPPSTGVITVKGSNACGTGTVSPNFNVTINPKPVAVVTAVGSVLTCTPAGGTYQWYYEGNMIAGATGQSYTVTNNTGYYWCVVTINGCASDISNKVWVVITGTPELPSSASFTVYPIPNNGAFTASISYPVDETFTIMVYNMVGEKLYELKDIKTVGGNFEAQIDLRPVATGMYSVIFMNSEYKIVKKVLINK